MQPQTAAPAHHEARELSYTATRCVVATVPGHPQPLWNRHSEKFNGSVGLATGWMQLGCGIASLAFGITGRAIESKAGVGGSGIVVGILVSCPIPGTDPAFFRGVGGGVRGTIIISSNTPPPQKKSPTGKERQTKYFRQN